MQKENGQIKNIPPQFQITERLREKGLLKGKAIPFSERETKFTRAANAFIAKSKKIAEATKRSTLVFRENTKD